MIHLIQVTGTGILFCTSFLPNLMIYKSSIASSSFGLHHFEKSLDMRDAFFKVLLQNTRFRYPHSTTNIIGDNVLLYLCSNILKRTFFKKKVLIYEFKYIVYSYKKDVQRLG